VYGRFTATGTRPKFLKDLKAYGLEVPDSHFEPSPILEAASPNAVEPEGLRRLKS
jgi:hypothetical protein